MGTNARDSELCLNRFWARGQPFDVQTGQAFGAGDRFILDGFSVLERAETFAFDAAEMNKNVLALVIQNEAKALLTVEPFYDAGRHNSTPQISPLKLTHGAM